LVGWQVIMQRLNETLRRHYQRDGIVFPIPVLSDHEVRAGRAACDDLEARLGGQPRTVEVRQMHLHFPWAYELATHPRILDAVEDVLGPDLLVWATELFAKHPQDAGRSIGWHRDEPYMGFDAAMAATAWVALSDSTVANSCMRAVPGPGRHGTGWRPASAGACRPEEMSREIRAEHPLAALREPTEG
jgi:ectoine hydroxylase-related dioxygenase (phytanoyl-CoA dioxygenase family)